VITSPSGLGDLPILRFLSEDAKRLVIESFVPVTYAFGSTIAREGEPADAFYVLASGRARVLTTGEHGEEVPLNMLRPGDSFGEMGLLDHGVRKATVRASSDVDALRLDRSVFEALVRSYPEIRCHLELQVKHRHLGNFLRLYTPFAKLPPDALQCLVAELRPLMVEPGTVVIHQGDEPGPMYVVQEGRLRVFLEEDGRRRYLAYLRRGDFFGELSLFKAVPRTASVEAISPCTLLALTEATFNKLLDAYPDFRVRLEERVAQYDYKSIARVPLDFDKELLPADATIEMVGPVQFDQTVEFRVVPPQEAAQVPSSPVASPSGPFATPDGRFVKKARRVRRFRHVRQIDEMDCGAASLAMVCRHFGRAVNLARVRQLVHTSLDGTSLRALCRAATELGLASRSVRASPHNLEQMPLPAIVHWEGNHWVVLYDADERHVKIADPARGLLRMTRAEFGGKWSGYAALFDYTAEFEKAPTDGASSAAWLQPFLRPYASTLAQAVTLALIASVLQMVVPVFTQIVVDRVLVD
jgi:CRP-like cAMP-binding protein/predicted double-glycine peptidase